MFFPIMNRENEKSSVISAFGGLNLMKNSSLGEFSDMSNLTADNFPYISTSFKINSIDFGLKNIQAFLPLEESSFTGVADGKFYYNGNEIPFAYSFMSIPSDESIKLINFSGAIIIIPLMYIFEYKDKEKNKKVYPLAPGLYDTHISVDTGGANETPITVKLNGTPKTWEEYGIKSGDSVMIQTDEERFKTLNVYERENKYDKPEDSNQAVEAIVDSATDDTLKIYMYDSDGDVLNIYDTKNELIDYTFKNTLRIFKKYPKFNDACIYANRLWLTTKSGETIHASAPGKPKELMDFSGLSTDSWYTEVGEDGTFTGIAAFRNGIVAFKENNIYHIFGDRATNFNIAKKFSGCGCVDKNSICETDTAIYFLYSDGVYEYLGSNPENISRKLALKNCKSGSAFSDSKKYYISLNSENRMFVYDRRYGLWHSEGDFNIIGGVEFKNSTYFVTKDSVLKQSDICENEWFAVLCDIYENQISHKGVNDLFIRAENGENSYIEVSYRVNDGEFVFCGKTADAGNYTFRVPVRFKKGDKYSIKISGKGNAVIREIERRVYTGGKAFTRKG